MKKLLWHIGALLLISQSVWAAELPVALRMQLFEPLERAIAESQKTLRLRLSQSSAQETVELMAELKQLDQLRERELQRIEARYAQGLKRAPLTAEAAAARAKELAQQSVIAIRALEEWSLHPEAVSDELRANAEQFTALYEEALLLPFWTQGKHPESKRDYSRVMDENASDLVRYPLTWAAGTLVMFAVIVGESGGSLLESHAQEIFLFVLKLAGVAGVGGFSIALAKMLHDAVAQYPSSHDILKIYWQELAQYLVIPADSKNWKGYLARLRCEALLKPAAAAKSALASDSVETVKISTPISVPARR